MLSPVNTEKVKANTILMLTLADLSDKVAGRGKVIQRAKVKRHRSK
jgi:hypothetical protein